MASPADRRYRETHEWHMPQGDLVVIGVSRFAVDELTDVTYLDVRAKTVKAGETFGEIESVKATSDLYAGIDGDVVEVNQAVLDNPAIINDDPYDKGWIVKVRPRDIKQLDALLSSADYDKLHS